MNVLWFTCLTGAGSVLAGLLGALTGLGGGVIIVPLLVIGFGVDMRYAIGASLVSVIATSSGAAAAYVTEGYSNVRLAMLLEIATTLGAISSASLAPHVPAGALAIVFGIALVCSVCLAHRPAVEGQTPAPPSRLAALLRLDSSYPTTAGPGEYHVRGVPAGFGLMFVAGALSGLLGIGSGALKVLALDRVMRLPFKVSTTTSNFMIGVTAAASAGIYLRRGYVDPGLAAAVTLGVLAGSMLGSHLLHVAPTFLLRRVFSLTLIALAIEMIYSGLTGTI